METKAPNWRTLLLPLGFVLLCVVTAIGLWRVFGGPVPLEARGYRITVPLEQAANVAPNAAVKIAGVEVGSVKRLRRGGDRVLVTVELEPRYAPLREGTRAVLRTKSLLGEAFIEITPGRRSAPPVPDDGSITQLAAHPAQKLDDILSTFDPTTRRHFRELIAGLARGYDGRAADVNDALGNLAPATASLRDALATARAEAPSIEQLVRDGGTVLTAVGERRGAVQSLIRSADDLLGQTARRDRELEATVRALPPIVGALDAASREIIGASPDLRRTLRQLRLAAPDAADLLTGIDRAAPELRRLLIALPALSRAGRRGLPALDRALRATGPALDQVYPALRELIPVADLASANRATIVGVMGNIASMFNGRYVAPTNVISSFLTGITVNWNEAIAGWTKRLPTNRLNPYQRPGGQREIERGALESFDCRNIHNPSWLPAFGGAPPCREQGAWTFRGRNAYFPRLLAAAPAERP